MKPSPEVKQAWEQGLPIQFKGLDVPDWKDYKYSAYNNPAWNFYEWRIKPNKDPSVKYAVVLIHGGLTNLPVVCTSGKLYDIPEDAEQVVKQLSDKFPHATYSLAVVLIKNP